MLKYLSVYHNIRLNHVFCELVNVVKNKNIKSAQIYQLLNINH